MANTTAPSLGDPTRDVLQQAERMATRIGASNAVPGDPAAVARQLAVLPLQAAPTARLYILVSFSMPAASLKRLAAQAAALRVPLVLRGMAAGSLAATAQRAATIIQAVPGTSFEIDPGPYRRFDITATPSFAIGVPSPGCTTACLPDRDTPVITGDVTLDYALERLARTGDASAALAGHYLARLKEIR